MKRLLLQLALLTWSFLFLTAPAAAQDQKKMTAHFINVGQADATLLEFPCGAILIDAGAQGPQQEASLIAYLHQFFQRRSDLNNTLDLVIITHAHIDHNLALDNVVNAFTVKRYIDNGLKVGSGKGTSCGCKTMQKPWASPMAPTLLKKLQAATIAAA